MKEEKKGAVRRSVIPAAIALAGMIVCTVMYDISVHLADKPFLNDLFTWAGLAGIALFIFVSPLIIYIRSFNGGAPFHERFWASMAVPVIKSFMVLSRFFGIYSVPEVLLLVIHHCVIGPVVFGITEVGIGSMICHGIKRKRTGDRSIRIFLRGETVFLIVGIGLFVLFLWGFGHFYYYTFLDLYIKLFLGGNT